MKPVLNVTVNGHIEYVKAKFEAEYATTAAALKNVNHATTAWNGERVVSDAQLGRLLDPARCPPLAKFAEAIAGDRDSQTAELHLYRFLDRHCRLLHHGHRSSQAHKGSTAPTKRPPIRTASRPR